jgi:hypothetical protein
LAVRRGTEMFDIILLDVMLPGPRPASSVPELRGDPASRHRSFS